MCGGRRILYSVNPPLPLFYHCMIIQLFFFNFFFFGMEVFGIPVIIFLLCYWNVLLLLSIVGNYVFWRLNLLQKVYSLIFWVGQSSEDNDILFLRVFFSEEVKKGYWLWEFFLKQYLGVWNFILAFESTLFSTMLQGALELIPFTILYF